MTWREIIKLLRYSQTADEIDSKRFEIAEWIPESADMFNYDQKSNYH